jgi:hypothetical protein
MRKLHLALSASYQAATNLSDTSPQDCEPPWYGPLAGWFVSLRRLSMLLGLVVMLLVFCGQLAGQAVNGTLLGTVSDSSGAVVTGAKVAITETNTAVKRETTTNESGNYQFPNLPPGRYEVAVNHEGFKRAVRSGVDVLVDTSVRVNLELQPGTATETIVVSGEVPILQTDRADTGRKIEVRQVEDLPLTYNRNFQSLLNLVPGTTRGHREHSSFFNAQDSLRTEVNGQSGLANNLQFEGVDDNERTGLLQVYIPPIEAIQTVDVTTSSYDAELGRADGAVTNVILKTGSNAFHGAAYEINRISALAAVPFFQNTAITPKAKLVYNYYGGNIGGPIIKNKTFFFGDILRVDDHEGQFFQGTVAPQAFRNGDFTGTTVPIYDPTTGNPDGTGRTQISCSTACPINPATGAPYPAGTLNTIDTTRIDPVVSAILAKVPLPNVPGLGLTDINNIAGSTKFAKDSTSFDVRIDHNASPSDRISGRFSFQNLTLLQTPIYGDVGGPSNAAFSGTGRQRIWNTAATYDHVFSSRLITQVRLGVNHYRNVANNTDRGNTVASELGVDIPGANLGDPNSSGIPCINVPGAAGSGTLGCMLGYSASLPWVRGETNIDAVNIWTMTKSNHTVKWGVDVRRVRDDLAQWQSQNPRGVLTFSDSVTSLKGGPKTNDQVNGFADFLLDMPNFVGRDVPVNSKTFRGTEFFTYIQDTWQITKKLTLNPGLRWEFYPPFTPKSAGRFSNYDPVGNQLVIAGIGANPLDLARKTNYKDFAPRLGVAYRLTDQTVVRGGFAISFSPFPDNDYAFDFPVLQNNAFSAPNSFTQAQSAGQLVSMLTGFPAPILVSIPKNGIIPITAATVGTTSLVSQAYTAVNLNFREPYVESWNLAIQRALPGRFVVEAAYVGNHGVDLPTVFNINAATVAGSGTAGRPLVQRFGANGPTADVAEKFVGTSSNYHALQVKFDRKFSGGLLVTTAYTYGKALGLKTDGGSVTINSTVGALADYIGGDIRRNYAPLEYDRRHTFVNSIIYELPFGKGKPLLTSGVGRQLLGGWQVSTVLTMMTGTPLVFSGGGALNAPGNQQVPNLNGPFKVLHGIGPGQPWFDTTMFSSGPDNSLGTAPRIAFSGPGLFNLDASVFRRFAMKERIGLELRAEAISVTNTPQFSNPVTNVNSSSFGLVTSTRTAPYGGNRTVQLGAKLTF